MKKKTIRNAIIPILKNSNLGGKFLCQISNKKNNYLTTFNSSYVHLLSSLIFKELNQNLLYLFNTKEEALYALNELENWYSKKQVLFFPSTHLNPYQVEEVKNANIVLRTGVLQKLESDHPYIIVSYTSAVSEKIISQKEFKKQSFLLKVNDKLEGDFLNELLFNYHFKRVDYVTEPGEFSVRGSIIDVFSYSYENPIRIGFFGNEIEKIKSFDIETQLSKEEITSFILSPNIQKIETEKKSLLKHIKKNTHLIIKDGDLILKSLNNNYLRAENIFKSQKNIIQQIEPHKLYVNAKEFNSDLQLFKTLEYPKNSIINSAKEINTSINEPPSFHKNFSLLADDLKNKTTKNYTVFINCNSEKQAERLNNIFKDLGYNIPFKPMFSYLHQGFIDKENKISVYTDHQIFDRYHSFTKRNRFAKSESLTLKELTQLKIGDFVTHIDHGVGKFMGLKKLNNSGKIQEAIKLNYLNNDILYINIHSLHKISKHSSASNSPPTLNKLGSKAWSIKKNKTKKRVKEIAYDLIKLYAKRKSQKGFEYEPDSYLQHELEASFMYEDTPDQEKATTAVKLDMQSNKVMDRLICGDVGFGKTEVAIRAAFKATANNKQVAILVPTTILAYQHFNTFIKRLKEFPVSIDYLNRFRSSKQKKEILEKLKNGTLDIIIGTHQLTSKDVKFKDLGLLIIDEEHKFGVSLKDKLKTLKTTVDTLTLTATPIPRTLQFSLMAARDMSIIKTPPPNRQTVETQRITLDEEKIRDAILLELQRNGQVFFINNRIANLPEIASMVQRLVPEARIVLGHGQMDGKVLENNLMNFINHKKDILIATSIIESGLDIPNANTIFINNSHQFGLADLHQMRGRVGRSNKKAYCYLIAPQNQSLTNEARKRLNAIETFSDLGAGFHIALKDLEIRGAGDILGAEQSGFISDIGFDAYQKIMNEAVNELKINDFKHLFSEENELNLSQNEVQIETDLEVLIPDNYVNDVEERLALYQRLSKIDTLTELENFKTELVDRFGIMPKEVASLLKTVELKWLCRVKGITKIVLKQNRLLCYLPEENSSFYETDKFKEIIALIHQHPKQIQLKEKTKPSGKQLYFSIEKIENINQAIRIIK